MIFGGDMTRLDAFTKEMLTNPDMLAVNQHSTNNRQVSREKNRIVWTADVPGAIDNGTGVAECALGIAALIKNLPHVLVRTNRDIGRSLNNSPTLRKIRSI